MTLDQAYQLARQQFDRGQPAQAEQICRQILAHQPNYPQALYLLGIITARAGLLHPAIDLLRKAVAAQPDFYDALNDLAGGLEMVGQREQALAVYRSALRVQPDNPIAHYNLGACLGALRNNVEAIAEFRAALALRPDFHEALNNLGNALADVRAVDEGVLCLARAAQLQPNRADYHHNLAGVLRRAGDLDRAAAHYRRAISLQPNLAAAFHGLGNVLRQTGDTDNAINCYRQALTLAPASPDVHSSLLITLHFKPEVTARQILAEARHWDQIHAQPLARGIAPHLNTRDPNRRLRVGYVSPDFLGHAVGRFMLPLLTNHNREQVEIICYSDVAHPDAMTARLQAGAHKWRDVAPLSDQQLAELIRKDQIDILVDLAMHTDRNRLLTFARKPAPVQVTYLAYCSTTGLSAMNYRLSDPFLDPAEFDDGRYTEKTVRLPSSFWCYPTPDETPPDPQTPSEIGASPITFGCLNNFSKTNEPLIGCWIEILRSVPDSRLILHAHPGSHRQKLRDRMAASGIDPNRVEFVAFLPMREYLERYRSIDIALDTFPYAGGTTTCDALWIGTPVVSYAGQTAVSRGGASILSNVGLPELIAHSTADYVRLAVELARDRARLDDLRSTLREGMRASPLMNAAQCTRDIESAYRQMWRGWCASKNSGNLGSSRPSS